MSEKVEALRRELDALKLARRSKIFGLPDKVGLSLYGAWECSEVGRRLLIEDALARAGYLSFKEAITDKATPDAPLGALIEPMALKWLKAPGGETLGYIGPDEMLELYEKAVEIAQSGDFDREAFEENANDPDFPVLEFRPLATFADAEAAIMNGRINWPTTWRAGHNPEQLEECLGLSAGKPRGCVVVLQAQRIDNPQASNGQKQADKGFLSDGFNGAAGQLPTDFPR